MFFTTIMEIHNHFQKTMIFKNYFFMVKSTVVQPPLLARLATVSHPKCPRGNTSDFRAFLKNASLVQN